MGLGVQVSTEVHLPRIQSKRNGVRKNGAMAHIMIDEYTFDFVR